MKPRPLMMNNNALCANNKQYQVKRYSLAFPIEGNANRVSALGDRVLVR
jgi:hypothetical protein